VLDFGQNQNHKYYLKKLCDKPFLEYPTDKLVSVGVAAAVVVAAIVGLVVVVVELVPVLVQIPFSE
jgi:hypothetical protein